MHLQKLKFENLEKLKENCKLSTDLVERAGIRKDRVQFLNSMLSHGLEASSKGDLEEAFRFYMRYVEIVAYIRKIEQDQKFWKATFGKQCFDTIKLLEEIEAKLRKRYEEKLQYEEAQLKKIEAKKRLEEIRTESEVVLKIGTFNVPDPKNPIKPGQTSIEPLQLSKLMQEPLLLVDVRPPEEFAQSCIIHDPIINIPPIILQNAKSAFLIEKALSEPAKSTWARRTEFKFIVLVDRYSDTENLLPGTPILDALEAINKWDPNTKYQNKAVFLNGGYEEWLNVYPTRCTNPKFQYPSRDVSMMSLEGIQYPKEIFYEPKPVAAPPKPTVPTIPDRNKKPLPNDLKGLMPNPAPHVAYNDGFRSEIEDKPKDKTAEVKEEPMETAPKHKQPTSNEGETLSSEMNKLRFNGVPEPSKSINRMNIDESKEITLHPLKSDGGLEKPSPSSGMKRSLSMPKLNEEGAGAAPSIPTFDRSSKPQSPRNFEQSKISKSRDLRDYDPVYGKVTPGLTGLKNLRNTCYMNSILQCLSNTQALNSFFRAKDFDKNCESKTEGAIAEEFRSVIFKLWGGEYKSFACKGLKNRIGHYRNTFAGYDQQDSHEFLTILIDWLHEDLKKSPVQNILDGASEESGERAWGEFKKNNTSPIQELFYGQQRSVVTCTKCHERSITFEPFSNLSLPLPSGRDACTLSDCLDLYVQEEIIYGWECPKCKTSRKAEKKLDITRLPPILVIHFKRFTSDGWCRKQQTYVDFPVKEALDMSNFVCGAEHRNILFSLYAVSNHYGTMDSGHYTAYCKGAKNNKWYKYDDQEVCEISPEGVKTSAAYIVFYSKLSLGNT